MTVQLLCESGLQVTPTPSADYLLYLRCVWCLAGAVLASLQQLQEAAGRCRIRHWLLRVLSARDVRLQLAAAFVSVAAALEGLSTAAAASVLAVRAQHFTSA